MAEVKWFLEPTPSFPLWRRVTTTDIAIVVAAHSLGALLLGRLLLLDYPFTAASRTTSRHSVFLGLQLCRQAGVGILY